MSHRMSIRFHVDPDDDWWAARALRLLVTGPLLLGALVVALFIWGVSTVTIDALLDIATWQSALVAVAPTLLALAVLYWLEVEELYNPLLNRRWVAGCAEKNGLRTPRGPVPWEDLRLHHARRGRLVLERTDRTAVTVRAPPPTLEYVLSRVGRV